MFLHARSNQYIGSGHHHSDVGMFYFSSGGVNWITESPFAKTYDGKYHNEVLIDGIAEPDRNCGRGTYIGATINDRVAFAAIDQTQSYTYAWTNQIILWDGTGDVDWMGTANKKWEVSSDALATAVYKGTQRYKSRPWWPSYNFSNWLPVCQTPWNPVKYAFRTAGLVRGPHPYSVISDDVKKDGATHLYQWTAMLADGVWRAKPSAFPSLPQNMTVLAHRDPGRGNRHDEHKSDLSPAAGESIVFAVALSPSESGDASLPLVNVETLTDGPPAINQKSASLYDRLTVNLRSDGSHFKVLLIPAKFGDPVPAVTFDPAAGIATVTLKDQVDRLTFKPGDDGRTRVSFDREGKPVALVP